MKSALYVGAVTKAFADSINYALKHKKTLNQKDTSILLQNLFTRSFTKGYLLNESNDQLTSTFRPNHIGQKIGKVIASYAHKIKIQLTKPVSQKDKIVILQKEDVSFYLSKMKVKDHYVKKAYPNEIIELEVHWFIQNQGDVYQCLENKKVEAIELQNQQTKKIPIQLFFLAQYNQPMKLIIKDNLHHTLTIESTYLPLKSQTDFLTEEKIKEQLTKFKNTIYECQHFECQIEKQLYIPIKELNQIRREAIEKLNLCRANFNHRDLQDIKIEKDSMDWMNRKIDKSLKIAVKVKNLSQLEALLPYKIDYVYYDDRKTFNQAKKILPQIIYCTNRIDVSIPAEKKQVLIHQLSCLKAYSKQTWLSDIYCNVTNSLTVDFCL